MQFATVQGEKRQAAPGQLGECPACSKPVLAKCGQQRIWHWAHEGKAACDFEREPETQWHRDWKNQFPIDCQEVILRDKNGEKHIADVLTEHGLVIEFQHSHLPPQERRAREAVHQNMVWVVDGRRLARDLKRFLQGRLHWRKTGFKGYFTSRFPDKCFPADWLECSASVFFDFDEMNVGNDALGAGQRLIWGLLPGQVLGRAVIVEMTQQEFVRRALNGSEIIPVQLVLKKIGSRLAAKKRRLEEELRLLLQLRSSCAQNSWPAAPSAPWRMRSRRSRLPRF